MLAKPQYLALDSSHLGDWIKDRTSDRAVDRARARSFTEWLERSGFVLLFCFHHFEELVSHENDDVAAQRIRFIGRLPFLAWIGRADGSLGLGAITDILAAEAAAAMTDVEICAAQVRDIAFSRLVQVGSGEDAIGPDPEGWMALRPLFQARNERSRAFIAVTQSRVIEFDDLTIDDVLGSKLRQGAQLNRRLEAINDRLAHDIATRGDPRISAPDAVASEFMRSVVQMGHPAPQDAVDLLLRTLYAQGVTLEDINPTSKVRDLVNLGMFRSQLRVVAEDTGFSYPALAARVRIDQIPTWVIRNALRQYRHDQPRRMGSEYNDSILACLGAYADVTIVDKRTLENLRRASRRVSVLSKLLRRIEKVARYTDIPALLRGTSPLAATRF
ncbi:hypothetical protein [Thalassobaculum salexigens]|uniref:hypothetical protein n=1 Tax=Thalassobaculum salexigens TaxID=455360 RepID=UPI00048AC83D|nr:hypothetical protein [Thalassobaculum salexigens]